MGISTECCIGGWDNVAFDNSALSFFSLLNNSAACALDPTLSLNRKAEWSTAQISRWILISFSSTAWSIFGIPICFSRSWCVANIYIHTYVQMKSLYFDVHERQQIRDNLFLLTLRDSHAINSTLWLNCSRHLVVKAWLSSDTSVIKEYSSL